ncbi:hypothetical protein PQR62_07095 [Herbaspirillum lusitanum]|uniref:Uncharacterized protein n=1 Tax=Herbaspirillum lusitanum TaxID=213312 RepID=A0ABW9A6K9_9BURK
MRLPGKIARDRAAVFLVGEKENRCFPIYTRPANAVGLKENSGYVQQHEATRNCARRLVAVATGEV